MRIQGVVCLKDAFRRVLRHPSFHEAETREKNVLIDWPLFFHSVT